MENTANNKELLLEVEKGGYRRLLYRQITELGDTIYLEESDLVDFSRPLNDNSDFSVFFSLRAFWKSFTDYTSNEGLLNRQVWHQNTNEWLELHPVFVHENMRAVIQESLRKLIKENLNQQQQELDGIRFWLKALSTAPVIRKSFSTQLTPLRHAV